MNSELIAKMESFWEGDLVSLSEILVGLTGYSTRCRQAGKPLSDWGKVLEKKLDTLRDLPEQSPFFLWLAGTIRLLESDPAKAGQAARELADRIGTVRNTKRGSPGSGTPSAAAIVPAEMIVVPSSRKSLSDEMDFSAFIEDKVTLDTFLQEADEQLDGAQLSLLDLEYDSGRKEAVNIVFRCFHTLKSSAAFLGIKNVEIISHHMESMLQKVRDGSLVITGDLTDVLFYGIGFIRDLKGIIPGSGYDKEKILSAWRAISIEGFVNLVDRIVQLHATKKIGEILEEMGKIDQELVGRILKSQNRDSRKFGEIAVEQKIITREDLDTAVRKQETGRTGQNFVKVSVDRLNTLVDMVGELVVNQSMFRSELHKYEGILPERDILQLESITTTIKDIVLSMGMVPIAEVFQKLRIVIRNTGRELGRLINLEIEGEDTELDRNLIESIYDPLVHIVRNAISHGLEPPDDRERAGKKPVGNLRITARYKGNGIEIIIVDDGRGIDPVRVIDKAVGQGLVRAEDRQLYLDDWKKTCDLLFLPGFSTKDQADTVSGRGVGLDVVMQNITRINGRVEIQSVPGRGVSFIIKLPLTLAIIDGFVIETAARKFVLPFNLVEEILVPSEVLVTRLENGMEMLRSRERYVPVVNLKKLIGVKTGTDHDGRYVYILVNYDEHFYAMPVDRVIGKQEIVIKNLNEVMRRQRLFSSGTIFGDGTIGFILDLDEIMGRMNELYT
jgi:two-component system chemotaxis sensor kinase CheA